MTNAEIVVKSIAEWVNPIAEKAMRGISGDGFMSSVVQSLIAPEWLAKTMMDYLGVPILKRNIEKIPNELIPEFSLNLVDGMIDKRVKEGELVIPAIGIALEPNAFMKLKNVLESNFAQYSEKKEVEQEPSEKKDEDETCPDKKRILVVE